MIRLALSAPLLVASGVASGAASTLFNLGVRVAGSSLIRG